MSKSLGNVVAPFELVKKYGVDAVRYYLLREILPSEDGDFTYEKFEARYNSDLASGLGNLLARIVTLAAKPNFEPFDSAQGREKKAGAEIKKAVEKTKTECQQYLEEFKFNEALKSIWELITVCDKYINQEKPWEAGENAPQVISDCLFALDNISDLLVPFLPETSEKIKKVLATKKSESLFPRLLT